MTQADRVHSTPPTNTSAFRSSRRGFLAQAAVAAAGSAALGVALAPSAGASARVPDAIYATIEVHRQAHVAHTDALTLQHRLEIAHDPDAYLVSAKPCDDENDAFEALVTAAATTLPGLIAWLDYLQELAGDFETEWMMTDRTCAAVLVDSFVASLKNIGVQA